MHHAPVNHTSNMQEPLMQGMQFGIFTTGKKKLINIIINISKVNC